MNNKETIPTNDPNLLSRSAAEALNTNKTGKIRFYRKSGWFITRWQAVTVVIAILILFFVGMYTGKSSIKSVQNIQNKTDSNYTYLTNNIKNLTTVVPSSYAYNNSELVVPSSTLQSNFTFGENAGKNSNMKYLIEPLHYDIYIKPFFEHIEENNEKFTFKGNVSIFLHAKKEIQNIVIGANNLRIVSTTLKKLNTVDSQKVTDFVDLSIDSYDKEEGTMNLQLHKSLIPYDIYVLEIAFHGDIQYLSYGLFQSIYKNATSGEVKWLVGANLDTPFARTVFPCFDSPTQAATYQLNIARKEHMIVETSSSNWNSSIDDDGWIWEKYLKTWKMPVQQLAFAMSSFHGEHKETRYANFTIWTPTKRHEVSYVLDIGPKLLQYIQIYFGVKIPTSKINIFGLRGIFSRQRAKMGIIYVSESDLLFEKDETSTKQKERITMTIASHLLEQWIENLIFQWGNDEWIKESLIQYLQYITVDFLEPTWKTTNKFYVKVQQSEMNREMENPAKKPYYIRLIPILEHHNVRFTFPVNETLVFRKGKYSKWNSNSKTNKEITNPDIYNQLYKIKFSNKGACIFHMLQHMLTESVFKSALKNFFEISKKKAVEATDLWNIMSKEAANTTYSGYQLLPEGVSLEAVINDWIYSDGYPLLIVERDYKQNNILFSQFEKDLISRHLAYMRKFTVFNIPISYTTEQEKQFSATAPRFWLRKVTKLVIEAPTGLTNDTWLLVNPQGTGLYRVNYDVENWRMLRRGLENGEFPDIIRAQLLDDVLFFAQTGTLNYDLALDFISYISDHREKEYTVWTVVLRHLNFIRNLIPPETKFMEIFQDYVHRLIKPVFNNLNSKYLKKNNLDHNDRLLRSDIFLWACSVGISECKTKARSEFDKWKNSPVPDEKNPLDPDMRYAILCSIMQFGGSSDYNFLYQRYITITAYDTNPEKYIYLKSLFCYKHEKSLQNILSKTLINNYSISHLNNVNEVWRAAAESFYKSHVSFDYLLSNWELVKLRYSEFKTIIQEIVIAATSNIQNTDQLEKFRKFKNESATILPYLEHSLHDAVRQAEDQLAWKNERMNNVVSWMGKKLEIENGKFETQKFINK